MFTTGDGGPAINANLNAAAGVTADGAGGALIAGSCSPASAGPASLSTHVLFLFCFLDSGNHCIRRVNAAGIISTVVGGSPPTLGSTDNTAATLGKLNGPTHIVVDLAGNWIIAGKMCCFPPALGFMRFEKFRMGSFRRLPA